MESNHLQCLNCQAELNPEMRFCPQCGQKNIPAKVPVKELFGHFIEDYFTVDHKLTKSVFWLLYRPGFLTLEYISGKRASYIAPVRVFLFFTILFFVIENYNLKQISYDDAFGTFFSAEPGDTITPDNTTSLAISSEEGYNLLGDCYDEYRSNPDSVKKSFRYTSVDDFMNKCHAETPFAERFFIRKLYKMEQAGLGSLQAFLLSAASKVVFLMVPLFALLMKLIYRRSKRYYFEHFVFAVHLHTFLFIVFILMSIAEMLGIPIYWEVFFWGILVYFAIALRKVFQQSWLKSALKTLILSALYIAVFLPFGAILTLIYTFLAL